MSDEIIILAGGLGTRLRSAVPDLPKCMAPVNNRPFISYLIDYFIQQGVTHFIFSLGYMHEAITALLKENYPSLKYSIVIEEEPLGTGGAIAFALQQAKTNDVLVTNGDTLFLADVKALTDFHLNKKAECSLTLKPMQHFNRYGVVETDDNGCVRSFKEKKQYAEGLINGGLYMLNKAAFSKRNFPSKFLLEKDYLESFTAEAHFYAKPDDGYFIDIGIPEDYHKAQTELKHYLQS